LLRLLLFEAQIGPYYASRAAPQAAVRRAVIMHLAGHWTEMTPSRRLLMNSIGSLEKRKQAQIGHIHQLAQSDPQQAERLVDDLDLNDEERQQLLETIGMIRTYR
jgi:hypothetical protein